MKKPREYTLRPLMHSVTVQSLANGLLQVDPRWKCKPGAMNRLAAAARLEKLVNDYLRRRK